MIDRMRLHSITGGDAETEAMLLGLFIDTAERVKARLRQDAGWRESVHELKGAAANLGAEALQALCKQFEFLEPSAENRAQLFDEIDKAVVFARKLINK